MSKTTEGSKCVENGEDDHDQSEQFMGEVTRDGLGDECHAKDLKYHSIENVWWTSLARIIKWSSFCLFQNANSNDSIVDKLYMDKLEIRRETREISSWGKIGIEKPDSRNI